jgi:hypothetical protein
MIYVRFAVVLGWMAAVWMNRLPAQGADFALSVLGVDSQRRPTLLLTGLAAGRYGLEASTNLSEWFSLTSASAATGPLSFVHSEAAQLGTVFYRGVQLPDLSAVVPQVDSNRVATGLITMESGGSLVLTNESGMRFTFSVGPSNVMDTVAVRMQLVTNFTSFPYPNEMRTAVVFEPSGFEFYGAGLLEISFPTNVLFLKLSSFAFNADGLGFHLTPDVVSTNRVRIPVTHFSGVGSGLWAATDRTKAVTTFIENTQDRMSQELAGILGRERGRQLLGEDPQTDVIAEMELRQQDYYDNYLKPFFAEAEKDCALAQFLTRQVLGVERQSQLIGLENGPGSPILGSATSRVWTCNCLKEAINACEAGTISDKTLLRTLLGVERQAQLLGGGGALEDCGLGSLDTFMDQALNKKLPCVPDWFGVMSYSDGGSRTWDCSGGFASVTCKASTTTALSFEADVERVELVDESFPPFFTRQTWRLKLFPQANGSFASDSVSTQKLDCGGKITTTHQKNGADSGPLDLEAEFTFEDGELTDFNVRTLVSGDLAVKTTETSTGVTTPCDTGGTGSSDSHLFRDTIFLSPESVSIDEVTFSQRTPTALEGAVSGTRSGLDEIRMPYSWTFSLRRNGP